MRGKWMMTHTWGRYKIIKKSCHILRSYLRANFHATKHHITLQSFPFYLPNTPYFLEVTVWIAHHTINTTTIMNPFTHLPEQLLENTEHPEVCLPDLLCLCSTAHVRTQLTKLVWEQVQVLHQPIKMLREKTKECERRCTLTKASNSDTLSIWNGKWR